MKAWVLHNISDIRYEYAQEPQIGKTEVLIAVKAAGICGSDIPRIYRDGAHRMPLIPGHEFSGEVVGTGVYADNRWLRKRVGIYPLIPCRECMPCQKGGYEMCRHYSYLGSRRDGGFAQYVAVPADNLLEIPDNVTYEQAAMMEPMAVAVHAMRRLQIKKDDTVTVCGLGTIGMLLVMFLKERGVENIFVIGNKDYQRQKILEFGIGADRFCDSRNEDVDKWLMQRTGGNGTDIFFECVGKNETVSQAVNMTAAGGKICFVGNPYTDMKLDKQTYWKILRGQLTVTGTWNSAFFTDTGNNDKNDTDWNYVLNLLEQERIAPEKLISHRFDLEHLDRGFNIMKDKSEDFLKIMAVL